MAFSPTHRRKTRHKLLDYIAEQGRADEGWRERPEWCSLYLWHSLLEELQAEGCRWERRRAPSGRELTPFEAGRLRRIVKNLDLSEEQASAIVLGERPPGRRLQVRPARGSLAAWRAAVDRAEVERGYLRPEDLQLRPEAPDHDDEDVFAFFPQEDGSIKAELVSSLVLPFPVRLRIIKTKDGRLIVSEVHLGELHGQQGGPFEIRSRDLRKLSLPKVLNDAAHTISPVRPVVPFDAPPPRRRTPSLDHAFLSKVADIYREAIVREPTKPYAYFAREDRDTHPEVWTASVSTARRWVWQARKDGLLGPAIKGKAGEQTTDDR